MTELVSATTLIKDALGISRGINYHGQAAVAGAAFDKYKRLGGYVEDGERDEAVEWLIAQQWKDLQTASNRGTEYPHRRGEPAPRDGRRVRPLPRAVDRPVPALPRGAPARVPDGRGAGVQPHLQVRGDAGRHREDRRADVRGRHQDHGARAEREGQARQAEVRPPFGEVPLQLTLYRRAELVGLLADRKEIQYRRYYVSPAGAL